MKPQEIILELLKSTTEPLNLMELSKVSELSHVTVMQSIKQLLKEDAIIEVGSHLDDINRKRRYFIASENTHATHNDLANMKKMIATIVADSKSKYDDLEDQAKKTNVQLSKIYINIIAILGVFVAIFSILVVNINFINNFQMQSWSSLFKMLGVINLSLVITLGALLFLIHLFVVRPLKKRD